MAFKNVFVMKGSKTSDWRPGENYITTDQLKLRHKKIVKMQKDVIGKSTQTLQDTIRQFKKDWPKVQTP